MTISNKSEYASAREALLLSASEDYLGLWEVIPAIRSAVRGSDAELMELAQPLLRSLWKEGMVDLFWGDPRPNREWSLNDLDVERVLNDPAEWDGDRPLKGQVVWLTTREP